MTQLRRVRGVNRVGGVIGRFGPNGESGVWPVHALASDPYYDDVMLLMHMEGSNNGTSFTDSSKNAYTCTANGNAVTSTTQAKFGDSSGLFDGNGDFVAVTADLRLTGDFTVECWVYPTATLSGSRWVLNIGTEASGRFVFGFIGGVLAMDRFGVATNTFTGATVSLNTWTHIALTRAGTTVYPFLGGTLYSTVSSVSATLGNNNGNQRVGCSSTLTQSFIGHIDDFRITRKARYTSSFTPPTRAFLP